MADVEVCVRDTSTNIETNTSNIQTPNLNISTTESNKVECQEIKHEENKDCQQEQIVPKDQLINEIGIDVLTHTKVDGLPTSEPSSLAMETLFRMMKINYRVIQQLKPCEQSYIVVKKRTYTGSLSVVQEIKNRVGININQHLTPKEIALVRFMTICLENQTQFCLLYHRWFDQIQEWRKATAQYRGARLFKHLFLETKTQRLLRNRLELHGFQNLTSEIILGVLIRDLHAISLVLGTNEYIMGNEPCSLDAVVFGIVAHIQYCSVQSRLKSLMCKNFLNLIHHCERIRERFWSDWGDLIGKTRVCVTPRFFSSLRRPKTRSLETPETFTCHRCLQARIYIFNRSSCKNRKSTE